MTRMTRVACLRGWPRWSWLVIRSVTRQQIRVIIRPSPHRAPRAWSRCRRSGRARRPVGDRWHAADDTPDCRTAAHDRPSAGAGTRVDTPGGHRGLAPTRRVALVPAQALVGLKLAALRPSPLRLLEDEEGIKREREVSG